MKTLQEQYNLILEGKGDKDFFMKSARRIFPQYINQYTSFDNATKILKSKSILTERFIGGLVTQSDKKPDWFKIFEENINSLNEEIKPEDLEVGKTYKYSGEITMGPHKGEPIEGELEFEEKINDDMFRFIWKKIDNPNAPNARVGRPFQTSKTGLQYLTESAKAIESKPTKEVVDMETKNFDYKDPKNIDNVFGPQFLTGYYAEMKDPKNSEKTVEELKAIVAKNLAKDIMYYTKDGQFGVKGLGYKESTPTKEVKGKYKAAGVEPAPKIVKESKLREHISKIIKEELNNE